MQVKRARLLLSVFSLSVILVCAILLQSSCTNSKQGDVLSTLEKAHPRLILNDKGLAEIKALMEIDENLEKYFQDVLKEADECRLVNGKKRQQSCFICAACPTNFNSVFLFML